VSALPRRARSLPARQLCVFAALLPGLLLQWRSDHALPLQLLLALAAAIAFEAIALLLRRQPAWPYLHEGSALVYTAVLLAWLPGLAGLPMLLSLFAALVLARQVFGGLGRNLFHPVAAGLAFAQVMAFAPLDSRPADWLSLAWLLGGIALLALRIVRWQAPVFLLAGAAAGAFASGHLAEQLGDPRWMLAAFFIAGDPVTVPESARARALAAAGAGLLGGSLGVVALPFALLAMNAASPLLDTWLDRGRTQAQGA